MFGSNSALNASTLHNQVFKEYSISNAQAGDVYLELETLGFFKNNEYFHEFVDGFSLFGFNPKPKIVFFLSPEWSLEFGLSSIWHFGKNRWRQTEPIGTVRWESNGNRFLFGSIENANKHQLIEPLSAFELRLTQPVENGLQFSCLLYTSPSPRDATLSRMPSSA